MKYKNEKRQTNVHVHLPNLTQLESFYGPLHASFVYKFIIYFGKVWLGLWVILKRNRDKVLRNLASIVLIKYHATRLGWFNIRLGTPVTLV